MGYIKTTEPSGAFSKPDPTRAALLSALQPPIRELTVKQELTIQRMNARNETHLMIRSHCGGEVASFERSVAFLLELRCRVQLGLAQVYQCAASSASYTRTHTLSATLRWQRDEVGRYCRGRRWWLGMQRVALCGENVPFAASIWSSMAMSFPAKDLRSKQTPGRTPSLLVKCLSAAREWVMKSEGLS